jgi:hypothetical protein
LKVPRIRSTTISVTSQQWENSAVTLAEHPRPKEGKHREKAKKQKKRKKRRADREKTNNHQAGFKKLPTTILSKIIRTTQNVKFH